VSHVVPDGVPAVFRVRLEATEVLEKIDEYLESKRIATKVNADRNSLVSQPFNERPCTSRLQCDNVATIRVTSEDTEAVVVVQVFERSRVVGPPPGPWRDDARSKGKETSELAAALEAALK